jgi:hypothetical protein
VAKGSSILAVLVVLLPVIGDANDYPS